jgi:UDP-N-acetylmuramate dehydrogenase
VISRRPPSPHTAEMRSVFGEQLREGVSLAPYTSARIGGPADFLLDVRSSEDLARKVQTLWEMEIPFRILGGGSNVLVSDKGYRGVVILNHARQVIFIEGEAIPKVKAESGASLSSTSRRAVERGWAGMEWAATVPGTIGGAIVGNAGAHGGDIASCIETAEILQRNGDTESWSVERLEYGYRTSILKRNPQRYVVLSAIFRLSKTGVEIAKKKVKEFIEYRQQTQPRGPSWGSMFKNPAGKSAGRLIDTAGLKGLQIGGVRVSAKHANFFINLGDASASDALRLIRLVRKEVADRYNVNLELEVELFGEWNPDEVSDLVNIGESIE